MNTHFAPIATHQSAESPEYSALEALQSVGENLPNYYRWVATIIADSSPEACRRVLDFGCGTGVLSRDYFSLTKVRPAGVELDPRLRTQARQHCEEVFAKLDDAHQKYDYIFSSNVLEHIEDDAQVVRSLRDSLTKEGKLALFLPAFPLLWSPMDVKVGHFRRYRARPLIELLEAQGLLVEKCRYYDSVGFFVTLIYKWLPTSTGEPSPFSLKFFDNFLFPISRWADRFCGALFGKNILVVARKNCAS